MSHGNALRTGRKHMARPQARRSPHVAVGRPLRDPVVFTGGRPATTGGEALDRRTSQRLINQHHEMAGMRLAHRAGGARRHPR